MSTKSSRIWVTQGVFHHQEEDAVKLTATEERRKFEVGEVRITTSEIGTEIKWYAQTPCMASLFVISDWVHKAQAPFVLRFNISGWFEEFYQTAPEVIGRLDAIIARADRHFPVRTFVEEVDPEKTKVAGLLMDIIQKKVEPHDYAVECLYNPTADRFDVERIGDKSTIAQVYGTFLTSFPCTGTSYADRVSDGYREVLASGKPRVDHVIAAMRFPDNQVHWVPYHRLILPRTDAGSNGGVSVVSQIAPVSFKII